MTEEQKELANEITLIAKTLHPDNELVFIGFEGCEDESEWQKNNHDWLEFVDLTEVGWYIVNKTINEYRESYADNDYSELINPYKNMETIARIFNQLGYSSMPTDVNTAYTKLIGLLKNDRSLQIKPMEMVSRCEDMSSDGRLELLMQYDGDIILTVVPSPEGFRTVSSSAEFCTGGGGGQSPNTHKALIELMRAMMLDNEEHKQYRG